MSRFIGFITILILITSLTGGTGFAQELIVFPAKGQSDEQMDKDKYDCYNWAKKETGFDPMAIPTVSEPPPEKKDTKASAGRGAVGGALVGAALGKVTGGSAKKGAVAGGVGGAVVGGSRKAETKKENKKAKKKWENQQSAEYTQKRSKYDRAYSACLEGKGYTVK